MLSLFGLLFSFVNSTVPPGGDTAPKRMMKPSMGVVADQESNGLHEGHSVPTPSAPKYKNIYLQY